MLDKLIAIAVAARFYDSTAPLQLESEQRLDLDKNLNSLCRGNLR